MPKLLEVKPLSGYRLRLRYDDGVEGVVDLFPGLRREEVDA